MSMVNSVVMLLAGFFLVRLLGQGSMSLSGNTLVPQWFIARRGRALSLVSLGGAVSSALLPPLNTWLIQSYGWRMGWRFWSLLLWAVMVPVAYLVTRDRPEEVGLSLDGGTADRVPDDMNFKAEGWTVREAMGTRSFWLLLICMMIPSAIVTGLIFHQVSVMEQVGLPPETAALVLSVMALVRLPTALVAGQIADMVEARYLLAASLGGLLVSMIVLMLAGSVYLALAYGILVGVMMAFQGIVSGVIWPEYFGRRYLGSIRGVTMMAGVVGSALGPLPFGFAYDIFGGYSQVILASMIFPLLGVVAALVATPPSRGT
jgi:MFS family permease